MEINLNEPLSWEMTVTEREETRQGMHIARLCLQEHCSLQFQLWKDQTLTFRLNLSAEGANKGKITTRGTDESPRKNGDQMVKTFQEVTDCC